MINRIIIRMKVLQIVYAYYQKSSSDLVSAEKELLLSLQKTYDLYHYLLLLIVVLTDAEQKRIDRQKHKFLVTDAEMNPDTRLMDNRLAVQLAENRQLQKFANEKGDFWKDDDSFLVRTLLDEILKSDIYAEYLESADCYEADNHFWQKALKTIILPSDLLSDYLEERSIYWDDDLAVTGSFVVKTLKQKFKADTGAFQELLPMYGNDEDQRFAIDLLYGAIKQETDSRERIDAQIKNWDMERLALMDLYIMQIAIAEMRNFPSIPVGVTLNEYIDLAHFYSSPKSSVFINGILDAIAKDMIKERLIFK
ncbi:MAG: transcription antitermination factor NusB [Dysgonamonadaceae bacterium]|jgi:N utilization substance protein B|nr:transcription antitermination factor NusB [Dysgonamonadaceae bacterium]